MNDHLMVLIQRREQLIQRSAEQRYRLMAHWSRRDSGPAPVSPVALLAANLGPWVRPAAAVAVPLLLVALVRRPGSVVRALRWVWPVWQGFRAAQRWMRF